MSKWIELISEPIGPQALGLDLSYPDIGDLWPIAIICEISILLSGLWLLAVWEYKWLKKNASSTIPRWM